MIFKGIYNMISANVMKWNFFYRLILLFESKLFMLKWQYWPWCLVTLCWFHHKHDINGNLMHISSIKDHFWHIVYGCFNIVNLGANIMYLLLCKLIDHDKITQWKFELVLHCTQYCKQNTCINNTKSAKIMQICSFTAKKYM